MNKYLIAALEAVLLDAYGCSVDAQGFLQHMDSQKVAVLTIEYDKYCRRHGRPRLRPKKAA